jgi:hypothetical protein
VAGETHVDLVRRLIVPELSPFDSGDPYTLICIHKSPNQADTYPVVHLNETLGAPSARAMEKLFAAIDAEEVRAPRRRRQRSSRTPSLATPSILSQNAPCK